MTTSPPNKISDITPQLFQVQSVLKRYLNGNIESIHLFGSAVDGGLKHDSDIDLMVTVHWPLDPETRKSLMNDLLLVSGKPGCDVSKRPLEVTIVVRTEIVPWRYPPMRELQFGEWLRDDLEAGVVEPAVVDRDLAILLTKVSQNSVPLVGPSATEVFDSVPQADFSQALLDTLEIWSGPSNWLGDERNVTLTLARIWFSASTGGIAPKDAAATWVLERLPTKLRPILESAKQAHLGLLKDDLSNRQVEVTDFVLYVKTAITSILTSHEHGK
jgi:streptomycin 3"-adenylyltransferase